MSLKRCPYCWKLFEPNPRTKDRQKVCSEVECQKKSKRASQKKWCEKNPTYFHDQYPRVKKWLDDNPGYLRNYRRNNLNNVSTHKKQEKRRKEISPLQAPVAFEARIVEMEQFLRSLPCCDIQDEIEARNPYLKPLCTQFTPG